MRKLLAAVALTLGLSAASQAAPVFFDDFSGAVTPNTPDGAYTVVNAGTPIVTPKATYSIYATTGTGNVDIVDNTFGSGYCAAGAQRCIDLDGTGAGLNSFIYTNDLAVTQGQQYKMTVSVAGNHRNSTPDNFIFGWLDTTGNNAQAYEFIKNLDPNSPFTLYNLVFTATESALRLFVQNATAEPKYGLYAGLPYPDNNGPLLQSIELTAVPLPAAAWLLLSGLGGVAAFARRRRVEAAA